MMVDTWILVGLIIACAIFTAARTSQAVRKHGRGGY